MFFKIGLWLMMAVAVILLPIWLWLPLGVAVLWWWPLPSFVGVAILADGLYSVWQAERPWLAFWFTGGYLIALISVWSLRRLVYRL